MTDQININTLEGLSQQVQQIYALAQAIANDFECFERMVAAEHR